MFLLDFPPFSPPGRGLGYHDGFGAGVRLGQFGYHGIQLGLCKCTANLHAEQLGTYLDSFFDRHVPSLSTPFSVRRVGHHAALVFLVAFGQPLATSFMLAASFPRRLISLFSPRVGGWLGRHDGFGGRRPQPWPGFAK